MAITAALVKELRDSTGAGMMDAKKALTETNGDMEAAVDWLPAGRHGDPHRGRSIACRNGAAPDHQNLRCRWYQKPERLQQWLHGR